MSVGFISFPRSGSNFIGTNYGVFLDGDVYHSHELSELNDFDLVFSVIRNPFDSIASMVALSIDHSTKVQDNIMAVYYYYSIFYHKILSKPEIHFIKFEDIIDNFVDVIKIVGNITGHQYTGHTETVKPDPVEEFLSSSKDNSRYNMVVSELKKIDLSKLNKLYETALERCIKL